MAFLVLVAVGGSGVGGAHILLTVINVGSGESVRGGGPTRPGLVQVTLATAVAGAGLE